MHSRIILFLCGAGCAAAQTPPLTLDDAIRTAWSNDPSVAVLALAPEIARAREEQASIRPTAELEVRAGAPIKGDSEWIAGVGVSQRWPRADRVEQARALARLGGATLKSQLREQRRRVAGEVRRLYYELTVQQSRREAARRAVTFQQELRSTLERRQAAGEIGMAEADLLAIETMRARQALALADAEVLASTERLRGRLRLAPGAVVTIPGDLAWLTSRPIPESPAALDVARPALALAAHRVREAEAALGLARAESRGDWTVGAGLDFERRANDYDGRLENEPQLSVRASTPWSRRVTNRGEIQERQALVRIAEAELAALRGELSVEIESAIAAARALRPVLVTQQGLLTDTGIPESLRAAYERGEVTSLQLAQARQLRLTLQLDLLDAAQRYAAALAEAETAAGIVPANP